MFQPAKQSPAQIFKLLEVRLAHLAEQETFQSWHALTIVGTHLSEEPVRLATAARAAVADGRGPVGLVAEPRGRGGGELARLQHHTGAEEIADLVPRTA